jgi:hypothetical protein
VAERMGCEQGDRLSRGDWLSTERSWMNRWVVGEGMV